jgi:hypothetical protein
MKKHASGFQIGAYVAGGIVGVYLLLGLAIYFDTWHGKNLFMKHAPYSIWRTTFMLYDPIFGALGRQWPNLFPVRIE